VCVLYFPSYIIKCEQYCQKDIKQLKLKNCSTDCGKTKYASNQKYIFWGMQSVAFCNLCMSALEK